MSNIWRLHMPPAEHKCVVFQAHLNSCSLSGHNELQPSIDAKVFWAISAIYAHFDMYWRTRFSSQYLLMMGGEHFINYKAIKGQSQKRITKEHQ